MKEEKLKKLLNELAEATSEPVRTGLAEDIKRQTPHRPVHHRGGLDTINIIIDLRVSKLAAAAVIIIATILLASFLGSRDSTGDGIYQDATMLVRYFLGGSAGGTNDASVIKSRYEYLAQQGREVAYYGDSIDARDSNAVLMQWKLSNGRYRVIFGDLREKTVSAEELIKLQAQMLQKKTK